MVQLCPTTNGEAPAVTERGPAERLRTGAAVARGLRHAVVETTGATVVGSSGQNPCWLMIRGDYTFP